MKSNKIIISVIILIFVIFILIFVVPIGINKMYIENKGYKTVWNGADVLSFYGAAIGAVGTVVLGVISWNQNNRLLRLEEDNYTLEIRPFVMLTNITAKFENAFVSLEKVNISLSSGPNDTKLFLELTNTTNSLITVEYINVKYKNGEKNSKLSKSYIGSGTRKLVLSQNERGTICFLGDFELFKEVFSKGIIEFEFLLENRFGKKYIETFETAITIMRQTVKGPIDVIFRTGRYKIDELSDDEKIIDSKITGVKNGKVENADGE